MSKIKQLYWCKTEYSNSSISPIVTGSTKQYETCPVCHNQHESQQFLFKWLDFIYMCWPNGCGHRAEIPLLFLLLPSPAKRPPVISLDSSTKGVCVCAVTFFPPTNKQLRHSTNTQIHRRTHTLDTHIHASVAPRFSLRDCRGWGAIRLIAKKNPMVAATKSSPSFSSCFLVR